MGFAKQWKGVNSYIIREPGLFFEKYDETHGIGYPLAFMLASFLAVMVPLALLSTVVNITTPGEAAVGVVIFLALGVVLWVLAIVEALVAHGIASLLGARGVAKTFEAYAFPTIVRHGLWWIPLINIGVGIYGLILQIKALSSFHDISTGRAAIASLIALILYLPVFVALLAVIATFVLDLGSQPDPQPAVLLFESVA